jgi:hypothetical protein
VSEALPSLRADDDLDPLLEGVTGVWANSTRFALPLPLLLPELVCLVAGCPNESDSLALRCRVIGGEGRDAVAWRVCKEMVRRLKKYG